MNIICLLFGHRLKHSGHVMKEWDNKGKALINKLRRPKKLERLSCTRCPEIIVREYAGK
jgi:hypothetical protein